MLTYARLATFKCSFHGLMMLFFLILFVVVHAGRFINAFLLFVRFVWHDSGWSWTKQSKPAP